MEKLPEDKRAQSHIEPRRSERLKKMASTRGVDPVEPNDDMGRIQESTSVKSTSSLDTQTHRGQDGFTDTPAKKTHSHRATRSEIVLPASSGMVCPTSSYTRKGMNQLVPLENNASSRKSVSRSSKHSEVARLNLELKKLQQQKQFNEEEHKLLQERRATELKMLETEQQLLSLEDDEEIKSVTSSENLYENRKNIEKWIDQEPNMLEHQSNFMAGGGNGHDRDNNTLLQMCVQNTANTHAFLTQQKVRELIQFSGEITEWPIFISEFRRSTSNYGLTDYDNLLRLDRALKGRARETVKSLLTAPENVPRIIKILETNFGRSDWIVLTLMDKVKRFGMIKEESIENSIAFLNALNNMVITMKNVRSTQYLFNPELLQNVVEKLPPIQKYNWGKFKYENDANGKLTSLEDFTDWYEIEISALASTSNPFQRGKNPKKQSVLTVKEPDDEREATRCALCKNSFHVLAHCKLFLDKAIEERRKTVSSLKLCFLCLQEGHTFRRCHRKGRCSVNGCKGRHNRLLHLEKATAEAEGVLENSRPATSTQDFCANVTNQTERVLLRIAPVVLRASDKELSTYALFDEGSTCTMIEEDLASKLELHGPEVPLCYQWTNDITHFEDSSKLVSLYVSANFTKNPKFFIMRNVRTVKNLSLPRQQIDVEFLSKRFPHLDPKVLHHLEDVKPEILIGQDNCGLIVPRQVIQPRLNQPILSYSKLGWTVHGVIDKTFSYEEPAHIHLCCSHSLDGELNSIVKNSFKLEDFGINTRKAGKSVEDTKAVQIMEKTLRYIGGRFEIGHLYKHEDVTFPDSKSNALKRLSCMERKMERNKEFAKQYGQKIEEYVQKGYATKLEKSQVTENPRDWYLPHFAVWNCNKPGQIRLVFDAASKSHDHCINDFLYQGPDYVPSLVAILWRFRQGKIAFCGDIKEMFHQVVIREQDRCSQRFFWRGGNKDQEPDVYQMNVMIFGAVSSPSKAQFVKNKNAERFQDLYPNILRAITKQHYVDDYLDSTDSETAASELVHQVIHVHKEGGFEMKKWVTNSPLVMSSIPEELRGNMSTLNIDTEEVERVLGLSWSPGTDEFIFALNFKKIPHQLLDGSKTPTKREVLRVIMSVFDPLGFLSPLVIKARVLMQNIWRSNMEWDVEIPEGLYMNWRQWLQDLHDIAPIKINRCYFPIVVLNKKVDLHIFSDASDKAYAAVAYFKLETPEEIYTSFVTSKFKVAPIQQQTIPKLELQGAVLACRLAKTICCEVELEIDKVHLWTDSLVVLKQIRSVSRRFPMFVACRIGEIQESTDVKQWHWVPSDQNTADLATKEFKDLDFTSTSKWFLGPDFLRCSEQLWPEEPGCDVAENFVIVDGRQDIGALQELPDFSRFSRYLRCLRAMAWVLHFINMIKLKKEERNFNLVLDVGTLERARLLLIRRCQCDTFQEELMSLSKNRELQKTNRLYKLSPFLDQSGVLRLKGRFPENTDLNLDYDTRNPIILDSRHRFSELLIQHFHEQAGHIGVETTISNLRQTYWIIHMRSAVKKGFANCQKCKIRKAKPVAPEMGLLPTARLQPYVFPFSYVGIDFFGPMYVAIGRRVEKRYGVLFTCLTLRAVHIELAASLDTSSAILAIKRFMARRGQPVEIFTDNGTNFVGAERELKEYVQNLDHSKVGDELTSKGIIWKFNPPVAPNMGGIWERMVRSIKTALRVTLNTIRPKEEVLQTLLAEAEYTVNSRPLTHLSVDPNEMTPITPNHFLLLRPGKIAREEVPEEIKSRKQWRFAEALANAFWKRWILEFRPSLINRQKWHSKSENFKIDDVVLIVDEKTPRNEWLMGRVVAVFPGKDAVVRVVSVKTKKGTYTRPVSKLCLIPTDGEASKSSRGGGC